MNFYHIICRLRYKPANLKLVVPIHGALETYILGFKKVKIYEEYLCSDNSELGRLALEYKKGKEE